MPRTCSLCRHPRRAEIDAAITRGEPYERIAERYRTSAEAISRHRRHIATALQRDATPPLFAVATPASSASLDKLERAKLEDVGELKAYLEALNSVILEILREALSAGRAGTALQAARELRQSLELIAELLSALDRRPTASVQVSIAQSLEWVRMREAIAAALEPYPEARIALARALEALGGGSAEPPPLKNPIVGV